MKQYRLYREQQLKCELDIAWDFFSSANNLARITPKEMNFVVKTAFSNTEIYEGIIIDYTVSPLLGIPLRWKTEITQVEYQKSFTDFQLKGPFKLWNHHHEFVSNDRGVLMKDTIDYALPLGVLGDLAHIIAVQNKLKHIFDYRHTILEDMFNQ